MTAVRPWAPLRRLTGDRRGATAIEFAIVAPVMALMMMGLGDLLQQVYAQSVLSGAVQKAARDAAIQGGAQNTAAIDAKVVTMVQSVARADSQSCATTPAAKTWCSTRRSYSDFASVAPEPFVDRNGNGIRDAGECFTDINGNKIWDADPGSVGQGGANDVTLYSMNITYPRLFPMAGLAGFPQNITISAQTLLKNQPYATQQTITPKTEGCP